VGNYSAPVALRSRGNDKDGQQSPGTEC
jgi:hypothetical protein